MMNLVYRFLAWLSSLTAEEEPAPLEQWLDGDDECYTNGGGAGNQSTINFDGGASGDGGVVRYVSRPQLQEQSQHPHVIGYRPGSDIDKYK